MAFCSSCGSALKEGVSFCSSCGQAVPSAAAQAAQLGQAPASPPAAPPAAPQAYAPAGYPAAAYPPPPPPPGPRRSLKWVWIGCGAAAAVIIAVVLVLVLVVFNGDDTDAADVTTTLSGQAGGAGPSTQPGANGDAKAVEQVVRKLFKAMEDQDADLLLDLMDPSILEGLPEGEARDAYRMAMKSGLGALGKMKFSGIEMKVDITSSTTAKVTLTAGKASITDAEGKTTTEEITDSSDTSMDLVKIDGKWYIATGSGPFM